MTDLQFNDAECRGIEAACGWTLSKSLRDHILQVTQEFLTLQTLQRGNGADVKVVLESYDKAASRFFNAIFADPSGQSAVNIHAHDLIESNSKRLGKSDESLFDGMLTLLRAFHIACNTALKELRELQTSPCKSDKTWRLWIWRLTEVIDEAGLPYFLSKDLGGKSKSDEQWASFARLVWQLQRCLPQEFHHTVSEADCAKAISDARAMAKRGWSPLMSRKSGHPRIRIVAPRWCPPQPPRGVLIS